MKTITFMRKDFDSYGWETLMKKLRIPAKDRKGWVSEITVDLDIKSINIKKPRSRFSWNEARNILRRRYGSNFNMSYDDIQNGYWASYCGGRSSEFYTDDDLQELKEKFEEIDRQYVKTA